MQLPPFLREAIEQEAHGFSLSDIAESSAQLSTSYRSFQPTKLSHEADAIAYLTSRMPATYAAAWAALNDARNRVPDVRVESILDIGAGPGSAAWAALDIFHDATQITLVEKDERLIKVGKSIAQRCGMPPMSEAAWHDTDLRHAISFEAHDLVLLSYIIGELPQKQFLDLAKAAWDAARLLLLIVEPGTMRGFSNIRLLRDALIRYGGNIVSPCPHNAECPIQTPDWCHFGQRVERSSLHRRAKGGSLGYEDEKYSYIAVSKKPATPALTRIVSRPTHKSASIEFRLCTPNGLQNAIVTRKDRAQFRRAQKAKWGSAWDNSEAAASHLSAKI